MRASPLRGRATRAPHEAPAGLRHSAGIADAGHTPLPWFCSVSGGDVELHNWNAADPFGLYVYNRTDGVTLSEQDARFIALACNSHYELLDALQKAEAAIARITEGDGGMIHETPWFPDGTPSKHDRCPHGRWLYEGCETCADAVLDPVLDNIIRPAIAKATAQRIEAGTAETAQPVPCEAREPDPEGDAP